MPYPPEEMKRWLQIEKKLFPDKEEDNCGIVERKLNEILDKLDLIECKQQAKDGYYIKNGVWRK